MTRWVSRFFFILSVVLSCSAAADLEISVDEDTGLNSWKNSEYSLELDLVQRYPSQTTAFFIARGFPEKLAAELADSGCVFQTIGKNRATGNKPALTMRLSEWRVTVNGAERPIKLKEQWDQQWPEEQLSVAPRLAFRWATFPSEQTFQPGDFNWGMISFNLTPGTEFDAKVVWHEDNKPVAAIIPGMRCAQDINRDKDQSKP